MADAARGIGHRLAPPRFLAFMGVALIGVPVGIALLGWREGAMAGFDAAALLFLALCAPLLSSEADAMRKAAQQNDANRALLLGITVMVVLVVLVAVAAELSQKGSPKPGAVALIVGTLVLAWTFSNLIYALHYAHLYYSGDDEGGDCGGIDFPGTKEPDYWDFIYLASCLGMTFQTSDTEFTSGRIRRIVTGHCLAAFVFNIGVLAFTINVLGGG